MGAMMRKARMDRKMPTGPKTTKARTATPRAMNMPVKAAVTLTVTRSQQPVRQVPTRTATTRSRQMAWMKPKRESDRHPWKRRSQS